jgi:hypothetical protein
MPRFGRSSVPAEAGGGGVADRDKQAKMIKVH